MKEKKKRRETESMKAKRKGTEARKDFNSHPASPRPCLKRRAVMSFKFVPLSVYFNRVSLRFSAARAAAKHVEGKSKERGSLSRVGERKGRGWGETE